MKKQIFNANTLTRRDLMKGMAAGAMASLIPKGAYAQAADPKFLIVLTATGGASLIDGMLAIRESECANPNTMNCFPDANVISIPNTPIRAVNLQNVPLAPIPGIANTDQASFVTRHAQDMMVVTHTGTSVNHLIAQKRALTGNDAWAGRTIQELVAEQYGREFPLPNINMSVGGYVEPGIDTTQRLRTGPGCDQSEPPICRNERLAWRSQWPS